MKLPTDTILADAKIKDYLLTWRPRSDKSQWLASAGYRKNNWQQLKRDLENLIVSSEASLAETTRWGQMFEIRGKLLGPNGKTLLIRSYWMTESASGLTKFITLYPDKEDLK